jgi:hypothetical protein
MSQTIILAQNQGACLMQMGVVVYRGRLYKSEATMTGPVLEALQVVIRHIREHKQAVIFHVPREDNFYIMSTHMDEHNRSEGIRVKVLVNDYPKHKWMRPWWVMVQRAWRAWREMRKTRQECFETFVMGTHARLGAGSVVLQFPVDLLGRVYDQLLPSDIQVKACVGER